MNTEEDEEFNRIEREAAMRKAAVSAAVAKREWVGLTDEEIDYQAKKDDHGVYFALGALWANAKLKERNT